MGGYWAQASRRVFGDPTWWWRVLVIAAILAVPVLGVFLLGGYGLVIMRDAAWGIDRGLPRFGEYREILRRSLDALLVNLVWGLMLAVPMIVLLLVAFGLSKVLHGSSWLLLAVLGLFGAALTPFIMAGMLRAAVYLKPDPGFSLKGIRDLIGRAPDDFRRVAFLAVAVYVVALALGQSSSVVHYLPLAPAAQVVARYTVVQYVVELVAVPLHLIVYTAFGLWGHKTNPSTWPPMNADGPQAVAETLPPGDPQLSETR